MPDQPARYHYIDALRAIAVGLLIIFHTGLIFTSFFNFVLVNDQGSLFLETFAVAFLHMWHMPLFFLLAGMTAFYSLRRRTGGQFALERVLRLFLPFVFGFLLIIPPQVYWDRVTRGLFTGSYFQFVPVYFTKGFTQGFITWHHLWFILYLFVLSMVALPVLLFLRGDRRGRLMNRLADFLCKPGAIFAVPLPVMFTELIFRARYPGGYYNLVTDWANIFLYLYMILAGYVIASDPRIVVSIKKQWKLALTFAVPTTAFFLGLVWTMQNWPRFTYDNPLYYPYTIAATFNTWCWVMAWVGLGAIYLNKHTPFHDYLRRVSYPYYILHQTVLIGIAFYVIQTGLPVGVKYLLIAVPGFFLTAAGVEVVMATPITRFMVGASWRRRRSAVAPAAGD